MTIPKIAILTSKKSWFKPYAQKFLKKLTKLECHANLYQDHKELIDYHDILFILSYFRIIPYEFIKNNKHNIVVHESNLPKGKGWSPLFWQILNNKNYIPIVLFEATKEIDAGPIYLREKIKLDGSELYKDIRKKQANKTINICLRFLKNYSKLKPVEQKGIASFYKKRTPLDSQLNENHSIKKQFNLLRIVDNKNFPAFFYHKGEKYILKIYKEKK